MAFQTRILTVEHISQTHQAELKSKYNKSKGTKIPLR